MLYKKEKRFLTQGLCYYAESVSLCDSEVKIIQFVTMTNAVQILILSLFTSRYLALSFVALE